MFLFLISQLRQWSTRKPFRTCTVGKRISLHELEWSPESVACYYKDYAHSKYCKRFWSCGWNFKRRATGCQLLTKASQKDRLALQFYGFINLSRVIAAVVVWSCHANSLPNVLRDETKQRLRRKTSSLSEVFACYSKDPRKYKVDHKFYAYDIPNRIIIVVARFHGWLITGTNRSRPNPKNRPTDLPTVIRGVWVHPNPESLEFRITD